MSILHDVAICLPVSCRGCPVNLHAFFSHYRRVCGKAADVTTGRAHSARIGLWALPLGTQDAQPLQDVGRPPWQGAHEEQRAHGAEGLPLLHPPRGRPEAPPRSLRQTHGHWGPPVAEVLAGCGQAQAQALGRGSGQAEGGGSAAGAVGAIQGL